MTNLAAYARPWVPLGRTYHPVLGSSARVFASRLFQTPTCDDACCASLSLLLHQNANRTSTSKLSIEHPRHTETGRCSRTPRPAFTISLRSPHFGDTQVISVRSRGRIVDGHRRPAERSRTILHLYPVSIARWREELMYDRLVCARRSGDCIVVIVSNAEDPRVISRGDERGSGSSFARVPSSRCTDRIRPAGAGGIRPREADHGYRRHYALRQRRRDGHVREHGRGKRTPDLRRAFLSVGSLNKRPGESSASDSRNGCVRPRDVVGSDKR